MKQSNKNIFLLFFFGTHLIINTHYALEKNQSAVTYTLSGGRLGDNLTAYIHAKWVAYKFNIPLLYKPFHYSDQLMMHDKELQYKEEHAKNRSMNMLKKNKALEFQTHSNTLYVIPYFPESLQEHRKPECSPEVLPNLSKGISNDFCYMHVDWEDKAFQKEIRSMISPKKSLNLLNLPNDCITVAVHIRRQDSVCPILSETPHKNYKSNQQYMDVNYPLKFPSDNYYIDQIKLIAQILHGNKIYFYIFTDNEKPELLVKKYSDAISDPSIIFDYRKAENHHDKNVLEDFFSLMQFDCLIRSDSNFSLIASKLADFKIVISPLHHRWEGRTLIIDKVNIAIAGTQDFPLKIN